jgi:hypothetical protein
MEVKMDFDIFSDLYKDVHGVRPRGIVATPELIRSLQQDLMVQNTVWFEHGEMLLPRCWLLALLVRLMLTDGWSKPRDTSQTTQTLALNHI